MEIAWNYCEKYNRELIVDSIDSGLLNDFGDVFVPSSSTRREPRFWLNSELKSELNELLTFPHQLTGRLHELESLSQTHKGYVWAADSKVSLGTPLDCDYTEPLLIREASGGGTASRSLLKHIRLTSRVSDEVEAILREFPHEFISVHIREGDDVSPRYSDVLRKVKKLHPGLSTLVISDGPQVIEEAQEIFGDSLLLTREELPPKNGAHYRSHYDSVDESKKAGVGSVVDAFVASSAIRFYYTVQRRIAVSGYSRLVADLLNEPTIRPYAFRAGKRNQTPHSNSKSGPKSTLVVVASQLPELLLNSPKFVKDKLVRMGLPISTPVEN